MCRAGGLEAAEMLGPHHNLGQSLGGRRRWRLYAEVQASSCRRRERVRACGVYTCVACACVGTVSNRQTSVVG